MLNDSQVAELLGVSVFTVRYWRKTGVGPDWFKMGRDVRYDAADVHAYKESCRQTPSVRAFMEEKRVSKEAR